MGKGKGEEEGSKLCGVYVRSCLLSSGSRRAVNGHYIIHRGGGPDVNLIYPCKSNKTLGQSRCSACLPIMA